MNAILTRFSNQQNFTLGRLELFNDNGNRLASFFTLELPYKNNVRQVSCIPLGVYTVAPFVSKKFGKCLKIQNVPNRSGILFHSGNFIHDTKGCVLVGNHYTINSFGLSANVYSSSIAMRSLLSHCSTNFTLTIKKANYATTY
jgi:hypothetical protein